MSQAAAVSSLVNVGYEGLSSDAQNCSTASFLTISAANWRARSWSTVCDQTGLENRIKAAVQQTRRIIDVPRTVGPHRPTFRAALSPFESGRGTATHAPIRQIR